MIWSISWKNVWRNKTRSLVVICAVLLGIFSAVMAVGIMQGWITQRIKDSIHNEISHVQIHNEKFMNNEELQYTIPNYNKVASVLDTMSNVVGYSPRVKIFSMVRSSRASTGMIIKGIIPEMEKKTTTLHKHIIDGTYFDKEYHMPSIVIGSKAAENLQLKNFRITSEKLDSIYTLDLPDDIVAALHNMGDELYRKEKDFADALQEKIPGKEFDKYKSKLLDYFSFYRLRSKITVTVLDVNNQLVDATFRVRGVYSTNNSTFDGMTAFVEKDVLQQYTGLADSMVHEVAIISTDNKTGVKLGKQLAGIFPDLSVLSWREIAPELAMYTDFGQLFNYVYVVIILLALAFGIVNTMLMSVLERIKELGMLMAIGMNKKRVFSMIMLESVFLTLTGAVIGMILSGIVINILGHTGLNFGMWAQGFEAIGYAAIVYPIVSWDTFMGITILVIITGILSAIWPARKALKLNPADALRTD